ncbi:hypothetical protein D3C87_1887100 [compost metagenome]
MEIGQRLAVVEPSDLRHYPKEQIQQALRFGDERVQPLAPVHALGGLVLVQQLGRARRALLSRQMHQREVVAALEVAVRRLEGRAPLFIHQP